MEADVDGVQRGLVLDEGNDWRNNGTQHGELNQRSNVPKEPGSSECVEVTHEKESLDNKNKSGDELKKVKWA